MTLIDKEKYINAPSALPSVMSALNYPMTALEISVTCVEESYAVEQSEYIKNVISMALEYAIYNGWSTSNSYYQNLRVDGRRLTFDFYLGLFDLLSNNGRNSMIPIASYNQYEKQQLESVTFRYVLHGNEATWISLFDEHFTTLVQKGDLSDYSIENLTVTATSNGPDPFRKLVYAYSYVENKIRHSKENKIVNETQGELYDEQNKKIITAFFVIMFIIIAILVFIFLTPGK